MGKPIRMLGITVACCLVVLIGWLGLYGSSGGNRAVRQVTDSTGTVVNIPVHPQRVVFLNVSNMDMYYAAGGTAVGKPSSESVSPTLQEKTKDVTEVGIIHNPNVETILSLNPDLVIGVNVPFHNNLRATLEKAGIPLYINALDSYDDVLETLRFYGELTGQEKKAAAEAARIEEVHRQIFSRTEGKEGPRTLIIFGAPGSFSMATSKSFSGDLLKQLGGVNIADGAAEMESGFVPLSMEYIAKRDPEVILFISMVKRPAIIENFQEEMTGSSLWQGVSAVQQGKIYYLPGELFAVNPGTRIAEAFDVLYNDLYGNGAAQ